jgi:hypothetical protein
MVTFSVEPSAGPTGLMMVITRRRLLASRPRKSQFLCDEQRQEGRIVPKISSRQPPRFHDNPEDPLQA